MKKIAASVIGSCLLAGAATAFADGGPAMNQKCGCWYVGAGIGYSRVSIDDIAPIAGTTFTQSKDESDTGWKIFAGYHFNPNFAVEAGYVDLGKFNQTANFTAPTTLTVSEDIEASGPFVDLIGVLPVNDSFSVYARGGAIYASSKTTVNISGASPALAAALAAAGATSDSSDDVRGEAGLGAQFDFNRNFGVRGEWERYFSLGTNNSGKGDVDLFSVNLIYTFF